MRSIVIIIGPDGSGKSTLENALVELASNTYYKAISATTRPMREGEKEGVQYFYKQQEGENRGLPTFDPTEMLENVVYAGNNYGLPLDQIHSTKDTIVVAETGGAIQIKNFVEEHSLPVKIHYVFLNIPLKVRKQNLTKEIDRKYNELISKANKAPDPAHAEKKVAKLERELETALEDMNTRLERGTIDIDFKKAMESELEKESILTIGKLSKNLPLSVHEWLTLTKRMYN